MPTYGIHGFVWNGNWTNEVVPDIIRQTAEAGFDLLEIPLMHPTEFDAATAGKVLKEVGLRATGSLALPKDAHMPFYPEQATVFLKSAIDKVAEFGGETLAGCIHCHLGTLTGKPPTSREREIVANTLGEVALYAKTRGVSLGVEAVNRYESYLYNIAADVLDLLKTINMDNVFLHLDTYHMNIEEHGFSGPLKQSGAEVRHIHMSESDRGIPSEGNVNWDDVFAGLKAINYTGPLVLEAFADINPDVAAATCLWRPALYSGLELATKGLAFLRSKAQQYGLQ
ncbi:MAG: sugar phosphate isomerase/epimerase [Chloroflexota bacterium]